MIEIELLIQDIQNLKESSFVSKSNPLLNFNFILQVQFIERKNPN
jgi:hypothetical protein